MVEMPIVSVIMPVYNGEQYLVDAINSILHQTFTNFEFIIIDDGSVDNTWNILCEYAAQDNRIVHRRNAINLGVVKSLNIGLELARGHYVARQDADDISLPERLAIQVDYLQHHPTVGVLGTACRLLQPDGQTSIIQPSQTDTEIRWRLLFDSAFIHPTVVFRRSLIREKQLFYTGPVHAEDYELWTRILKYTRGANLEKPLLIYRIHENSVSKSYRQKQAQMAASVSLQQISLLMHEMQFSDYQIESLRRCHQLKNLTEEDMVYGRIMFELFDAFKQKPEIDPNVVQQICRVWMSQVFSVVPIRRWRELWTSGLFQRMWQHDRIAVLKATGSQAKKRFSLTNPDIDKKSSHRTNMYE